MKCGECKWLIGERASVGIECVQPENKAKWDAKAERDTRDIFNLIGCVARYKPPSTKACKRFEPKED